MTHTRRRLAIAATLTAAALMTSCQSDSDSGSDAGPLSLSGLTKTADSVPEDGADTCPLPYDIAEAAKTADLDTEAGLGPVENRDEPVATAEGGKRAESGDPLADNPGALISCTFHIGQDDVQVHTIATRKPSAIAPLAPVVPPLTGASVDDAISYVNATAKAEIGEVAVTESGNLATVRLKLDGDGDAALMIGVGEAGSASLTPKQVGALAETLARQVQ
ncbi:hypothetical protein OG342_06340 [Streptomyces bobili]|uniref:hypothetical protein n=1 Tax=Streptomyces bobili TaxID=67280 RepID=UPI00225578A6|nr:hypothetical protein [Streptomyces bobili]MCX5522484.1 hypothetical protein [Streptomyces bobili]